MGLLTVGKPHNWERAGEHREYVRRHGVLQFLNAYLRVKDIHNDELLWGDEVEYGIFKVDSQTKRVKLSLRGAQILEELDAKEKESLHRLEGCTWHPEYGSWMVEATPRQPFSGYAADLVRVERNMRLRRKRILSVLRPGEVAPTMTCFPLMGVGDFVSPSDADGDTPLDAPTAVTDIKMPSASSLPRHGAPGDSSKWHVRGPVANSAYIPDAVINPHPRFGALTKNIRARRGHNVDIRIPLFRDTNTPEFRGEAAVLPPPPGAAPVGHPTPVSPTHGRAAGHARVRLESLDEKHTVEGLDFDSTASKGGVAASTSTAAEGGDGGDMENTPHVHMDAMAFGMGCCCLQVTFQARDVEESRYMYDQLAVLSPVMLALTAATPILKGRLVDTDVRWNTIATSVDDRTPAERGLLEDDPAAKEAARDPSMVGDGVTRLFKSRYDSISTYLHYCKRREENPMHVLETYNDIPCVVDKGAESFLVENGLDPALAYHVAHLFARDPLVIFDGAVEEVDDSTATEHFENIQSTNWQTVRWKPPPPREHENSPRIGWRTEFRSMEMQATDAENAAFVVFVVLVTRVILAFDLNLYIPLSKVDDNMKRAHERDGVHQRKFWWRMHMAPPDQNKSKPIADGDGNGNDNDKDGGERAHPCDGNGGGSPAVDQDHKACDEHTQGHEEMTIEEIMLGKGDYYPGLVPLVYAYLGHIGCDADTMDTVDQYMILICKRASGELKTTATWIREFVQKHPAYKHDSVVSQEIAYDLVMEMKAIGEGEKHASSLLGDLHISPVRPKQAYDVPLSSTKVSSSCLNYLVKKYAMRNRWTERDRQLKGSQRQISTEKTTQTSSSSSFASSIPTPAPPAGTANGIPSSPNRGGTKAKTGVATFTSKTSPPLDATDSASWWSGSSAAGTEDSGDAGNEFYGQDGRRTKRESSMSFY
eukprot:g8955.t1